MHKFAESDGKTRCVGCMTSPKGNCEKHPHLTSLSLWDFFKLVEDEIARARLLYPSCEGVGMAMLEEVGEVASAVLDEPRENVIKEGVQACAMIARLVLEGDPSLAALRQKRVLDR